MKSSDECLVILVQTITRFESLLASKDCECESGSVCDIHKDSEWVLSAFSAIEEIETILRQQRILAQTWAKQVAKLENIVLENSTTQMDLAGYTPDNADIAVDLPNAPEGGTGESEASPTWIEDIMKVKNALYQVSRWMNLPQKDIFSTAAEAIERLQDHVSMMSNDLEGANVIHERDFKRNQELAQAVTRAEKKTREMERVLANPNRMDKETFLKSYVLKRASTFHGSLYAEESVQEAEKAWAQIRKSVTT